MKIVMAEHALLDGTFKVGGQHFCEQFAALGHDIFYFSGLLNIYSMRHLLKKGPETNDTRNMLANMRPRRISVCDGARPVAAFTPMTFFPVGKRTPLGNTRLAWRLSMRCALPPIRPVLRRHGFAKPDMLIVTLPSYLPLFNFVNARRKIFRITDNITQFKAIPSIVGQMIRWGCENADRVVITARSLEQDMHLEQFSDKLVHISNGVDAKTFDPATAGPVPGDIAAFAGRNIALYMGAITYWFDTELVEKAARQYPDWIFVIIGSVTTDLSRLERCPNVKILGPRPFHALPAYLKAAAVGIIPFKPLPLIHGVSPIKMYEYMAMGLPVVSTAWKELELLRPPIWMAHTHDEFLAHLPEAARRRGDPAYRAYALAHDWKAKAEQMLSAANADGIL